MRIPDKYRGNVYLLGCPLGAMPALIILVFTFDIEFDIFAVYTILVLSAIMGMLCFVAEILLSIRDRLPKPKAASDEYWSH